MKLSFSLIIILFNCSLIAQNHGAHKLQDTTKQNMHSEMNKEAGIHEMSSTVMINIPMSMEGSGTSWLPEESPMHMAMYHSGGWMVMLHGDIKAGFTKYGSLRRVNKFSSPNWIMGMASHKIGMHNQIGFRIMMSIDRLTEGGAGYPLLFQTGESWKGVPLVDRQHPHDLFGELSVAFSRAFNQITGAYFYFGIPGEPAIGPPVYLHRISASANPNAPLGHHWQDATHITFGVATLGFFVKNIKIEASLFNGSEPDENRYDFDKPKFNSYSGRISYAPLKNLVMQASSAYLKNPEGDGENVTRASASVMHSLIMRHENYIATTIVWGLNKEHTDQHSFLLESIYNFMTNAIYGRLEFVQKPHKEFDIDIDPQK